MTEEFLKIIKQRYATWQELENIKSINLIDYNDNIELLIRFLKEQQPFLRYMGIKKSPASLPYRRCMCINIVISVISSTGIVCVHYDNLLPLFLSRAK